MIQSRTRPPPREIMLLLIGGFWLSRAISAAASLGLADLLKDGPRCLDELARSTSTQASALSRLLRTLVSVGIFEEDSPGQFRTTGLGSTLESDSPNSVRFLAIGQLGGEHYRAWGEFLHTLRTGEPAFRKVFGTSVWDYYQSHPENAETFQAVMTVLTSMVDSAVLKAIDFSDSSLIVEIGGGRGELMSSVLRANQGLRGVLFDLPREVEAARERIAAAGLADRCEVVGGDFCGSVPRDGDGYVLKWVLHDWDDTTCRKVLRNCFAAMRPGGRLWVIEAVIPDDSSPSVARLLDLNMMVITGGRERTVAEFRDLIEKAGFSFEGITETGTLVSVISARKPGIDGQTRTSTD